MCMFKWFTIEHRTVYRDVTSQVCLHPILDSDSLWNLDKNKSARFALRDKQNTYKKTFGVKRCMFTVLSRNRLFEIKKYTIVRLFHNLSDGTGQILCLISCWICRTFKANISIRDMFENDSVEATSSVMIPLRF